MHTEQLNLLNSRIADIYNSDLDITQKHDLVSRVICESTASFVVTIFVYSGAHDSLTSIGSYIDESLFRNHIPNQEKSTDDYLEIYNNLSILEYFEYKSTSSLDKTSFKNYKESHFFLGDKVTESRFEKFRQEMILSKDILPASLKKFRRFKTRCKKEQYTINSKFPTGKLFTRMLRGKSQILNEKIKDLASNQRYCYNHFFESFGIVIPEDTEYIGIPLWSGPKAYGVLRILMPQSEQSIDKLEPIKEHLASLSQVISPYLSIHSIIDGYKKVALTELANLNPKQLNAEANMLSSVLNCFGVLVRFSHNDTDQPSIVGHSENMKNYIDWIKDRGDFYTYKERYHDFLDNLFFKRSTSKSSEESIALQIKFSSKTKKTFNSQVVEYSINETTRNIFEKPLSNSLKEQEAAFISNDILQEALVRFSFRQMVIVKMPHISNGLATFVSTKNSTFTRSDIELMLAFIQKISFEIKHLLDENRIMEESTKLSTIETTELIVHQLRAPVNAIGQMASLMEKIIDTDVRDDINFMRLKQYTQYLKNKVAVTKRQIKTTEKFLEWENLGLSTEKVSPYRLIEYLIKTTHLYRDMASDLGLQIFVFEDNKNFVDLLYFEPKLFDEILNCLLDNAIKYSYDEAELRSLDIGFDPKDFRTNGHIHIIVYSTLSELRIQFVSWGAKIDEDEYETIFNFKSRGKHSNVRSTSGSGIGLYMVKKIVLALGGNISVQHKNHRTIFTITFKR